MFEAALPVEAGILPCRKRSGPRGAPQRTAAHRPWYIRTIRKADGGTAVQLVIIAAIGVAILGVMFALQNNVPVTVTFLVWRFDSSLAMVLLIALALGAIAVALFSTPSTLRMQIELRRRRRRLEELQETADAQRARIEQLESTLPEAAPAAPSAVEGLKRLIGGRDPQRTEKAPDR